MHTDPGFWRELRRDFEGLQGQVFSLVWYTVPPIDDAILDWLDDPHWRWVTFPDSSLRVRLGAMALSGAIGLGYSSEIKWYDRLRDSPFVRFRLSGKGQTAGSDGETVSWKFGSIHDVVKESITLCHQLEADTKLGFPPESVGRMSSVLSQEELIGFEDDSEANRVRDDLARATPAFPERAKWLKARLAERGWTKHDLQGHGGPEHRTTQKILDGYTVQEGVLRRVVTSLTLKSVHKGRNLSQITESEIPRN